ncbi:/ rsmI / Ribosomal RNA small subunit methyltransferase I /:642418 Reverse [Candidatus Hepatoplasma crinochetorum]|uniref:Ribosomal RNA small subunit methyltransferase I n=1 Tax=Candidatus Hepatoplasma crinochetorum TaxID=295596 RepID=A0A0G7ZLU3_9MOLU|nr:/ rsmI / Ribosomal RNA small subunit methyltransferase I /:642418 Reverse [Candidatus Hepatoplasma crinochetorum]
MNNKFYVVATPIGNLDDISLRALDVLKNVDFIFCENPLYSQKLLNYFKIEKKPLYSLHKYKEIKIKEFVEEKLKKGNCALITDSGTPTISDPGQFIINYLKLKEVDVIPIPGPNAIITALSGSGIIFNSFVFIGFLDRRRAKIIGKIEDLKYLVDVIIFYESPKRIINTLKIILEFYQKDLEIIIARELTKKFEEIKKLTINTFLKRENLKGEFVVLLPTKNFLNLEIELDKIKKNLDFLRNLDLKDQEILMIYNLFDNKVKKNQLYNLLKEKKEIK